MEVKLGISVVGLWNTAQCVQPGPSLAAPVRAGAALKARLCCRCVNLSSALAGPIRGPRCSLRGWGWTGEFSFAGWAPVIYFHSDSHQPSACCCLDTLAVPFPRIWNCLILQSHPMYNWGLQSSASPCADRGCSRCHRSLRSALAALLRELSCPTPSTLLYNRQETSLFAKDKM